MREKYIVLRAPRVISSRFPKRTSCFFFLALLKNRRNLLRGYGELLPVHSALHVYKNDAFMVLKFGFLRHKHGSVTA